MASERDEPAGAAAKAWRRLPESTTIGRRSLLATNQISPCHGRALIEFGPWGNLWDLVQFAAGAEGDG